MSVRAQIIKNGPNRVQNRPFGLKLGPEACQDRSGAFGMGLTHSKGPSRAKKVKKYAQKPPGYGVLVERVLQQQRLQRFRNNIKPNTSRLRQGVDRLRDVCPARCALGTFGNRTAD